MNEKNSGVPKGYAKAISPETFIALAIIIVLFGSLAYRLGFNVMIKSLFSISYNLLMETCFYIMAIAVLAGALSAILTEFGILSLLNKIFSPLMRPIYGLPGAAALGIMTTFLSDNPAILTLCDDKQFKRLFRRKELPSLCNLGTAYGMGLIVCAFVYSIPINGESDGTAVLCGLLGAVVGSIVSTRLMIMKTSRFYGLSADDLLESNDDQSIDPIRFRPIREGSGMTRALDALLEGGKSGVDIGLSIIPGVLIVCSLIVLMTNSPADPIPGVGWIPWLGEKLNFVLRPLFGFSSPQAISVPLTAFGSAGAAISLIPRLVEKGLAGGNDLAVFTSMCMCWSGYLSTHVAMMDSLKCRKLTASAIISHTIGGLCAGVSAHWFYLLFT